MSEVHRTKEEYIQRYAISYCNGDIEQAKTHEIVREVCRELEKAEDLVSNK